MDSQEWENDYCGIIMNWGQAPMSGKSYIYLLLTWNFNWGQAPLVKNFLSSIWIGGRIEPIQ